MADPASYGNPDRDIDQGLIALKKGTQLIKYSRKGKPKFCPFRVSPDETTLIWYSRGAERNLKLSSVSKIIPGQRTPVFKRFLRPEKEYLSFSLIYNNGDRSLDLICKDKVEAEIWIAGLKNLISAGQARSRRTRSDISDLQNSHPCGASLDFTQTISRDWTSPDPYGGETSLNVRSSDVSERANMQVRTSSDGFRISVSSTPSCSSGGSGPDDIESLGDVYVWGEIWCDGALKDGAGNPIPVKHDVLTPKPLESNVVLDVHQIACGVRHVALVTRQGEVFTWGEESGGRLGHGVEKDFSRPRLVEFLAVTNVDFVSCGEFHTCAVSTLGDLYTWGDGTHNAGLLGHGNDVSHWIPKRVSGPLEGLQVLSVACGTWHSALATVNGKLFTFGDGTFGALGHGDRVSLPYPREVQSLNGLKTIKVACGVWHTAAIVEVTNQNSCGNAPTRKLFTWGDGDKNRLGHGNKEPYLLPTCVSSLIDYNFHQLACGHNITIGLTTSGHVFIMGSNAYGQLGNPQADGKVPSLVQDKLVGEFVEEIACGAFHVAVLTSRSEVFTWGKGENGRLGHGDNEDRNSPTLVEALKDRHVKNIACGSNYTASICIHKWVSGADQSVCSGCRQAFGFTRKRHNCYNCGLVHCHACSSKKALKAALAPTPGKPHRVCDSCYMKLKKASEGTSSFYVKKFNSSHRPVENSKLDRGEGKISRILLSPTIEPIKYLEVKSTRPGIKSDNLSIVRASQVPSLLQLKDIAFPSSLSALQYALKPVVTQPPQPQPPSQSQPQPPNSSNSRPASPYSRRPSPPRSPAPVFSRGVIDSLRKTNDVLHQEVSKLQNQIKSLKQKSDGQDAELRKLKESSQESARLVVERASKCNIAVETMKSITVQKENRQLGRVSKFCSDSTTMLPHPCRLLKKYTTFGGSDTYSTAFLKSPSSINSSIVEHQITLVDQDLPDSYDLLDLLKEMTQELPPDISEGPKIKSIQAQVESFLNTFGNQASEDNSSLPPDPSNSQQKPTHRKNLFSESVIRNDHWDGADNVDGTVRENHGQSAPESVSGSPKAPREGQKEVIEQFEPGVYVTLLQLTNGTKIFKRVRFSKRRFAEQQAEEWWKENKDRLLKKYSPAKTNVVPADSSCAPPPTEENSSASPSS